MTLEQGMPPLAQAVKAAIELDAPLRQRLGLIADAVQRFRPQQAEAIGRLVTRLKSNDVGHSTPKVGQMLPGFVLPDENGKVVRLADLLRRGPLVVTFQRGHWCPYCRLTAVSVAAVQDKIEGLGAQLVAIVPEHARYSKILKESARARFPFLTDAANGYALSLDLAIWVGLEMERIMAEAGVDLPRYQGNSAWLLPIPATFVVGSDGAIVARYVDPDHRRRMEIDDLLAAVRQAR
ncbi:peroxiredoxin-like family protein [Mesorhizobium sp. CN2-181]|uniref:peroxiredoxin-like family protein n=1 Tax=Mesorhizobium yinganensis TaxID=3157707 RepID=UPI0032B7EB7E